MRAKAAEDLADEGDVAGAAIVQARNKFLTQVNCSQPWLVCCSLCSSVLVLYLLGPAAFSVPFAQMQLVVV